MAEITLVTGGARSGKSGYAQQLAESLPGRRLFVATCPVIDDEMRLRIDRHRRDRAGRGWECVEEPVNLSRVLAEYETFEVVLVDCLTLWVNNLLYGNGGAMSERTIAAEADLLISACAGRAGNVLLVTNEVGLGIVPDNPLARNYRDLVGRCNQCIAAAAQRVVLLTCGIPVTIKGAS